MLQNIALKMKFSAARKQQRPLFRDHDGKPYYKGNPIHINGDDVFIEGEESLTDVQYSVSRVELFRDWGHRAVWVKLGDYFWPAETIRKNVDQVDPITINRNGRSRDPFYWLTKETGNL